MKSLLVSALSSILLGAGLAAAQDLPVPVEQALAMSVSDGARADWRFTITIASADGDVIGRFDGAAQATDQWQLISPVRADLTEDQIALWDDVIDPSDEDESGDGLFFSLDDIEMEPGSFNLISQTSGAATYGFAPVMHGDNEEEAVFSENLEGELRIGVDSPHVQQIRIFAPASFKPHMAVRISAFEITQDYAVMEGLPAPVLQRFTQTIEGSAAFQQFSENVEISFSEIEYLAR
jgi:hypothetical protein